MLFDSQFFEHLQEKALSSPRKRSNVNLHQHYDEAVQRLFITMQKDSYVKPHRHTQPGKFECFLVIQGKLAFFLFDDEGTCVEKHILTGDGDIKGIEVPPNKWHCTVSLTDTATFFEVKPGPYEVVEDKDFAAWAPDEGDEDVPEFLSQLRNLSVGQSINL